MTIDVSGVKEVYLCGVLLWQDGVTLTADAQSVYACRTPYVGNPSALGRLAQALVQAGRLPDGYTMELQTSHTPYRWTLCYRAPPLPRRRTSSTGGWKPPRRCCWPWWTIWERSPGPIPAQTGRQWCTP